MGASPCRLAPARGRAPSELAHSRCRVGAPSCPGTPLTEPDLWAHIRLLGNLASPTALLPSGRFLRLAGLGRWVVQPRLAPQLSWYPRRGQDDVVPSEVGRRSDRLHRHRGWCRALRGPCLRQRPRAIGGLARSSFLGVPFRAVGWRTKQVEMHHHFTDRDPLSSLPISSSWGRLSTAFRYYGIIRLLVSLRHLVVSSSTTTAPQLRRDRGGHETSLGKNTELRASPAACTRAPRTDIGLTAANRLSPKCALQPAIRSRSVRHCTYGFYRTSPRGDALATSVKGSLRQGP